MKDDFNSGMVVVLTDIFISSANKNSLKSAICLVGLLSNLGFGRMINVTDSMLMDRSSSMPKSVLR